MKKTLQDQYLLIKEGKGHKGVFLTEAKRQFPDIVRNAASFDEAVASLQTKNIISENVVGLSVVAGYEPKKKESYELAYEAFLDEAKKKKENEDEKVKAEEKKPSKKVEEDASHNFDNKDEKNLDNMIFDQVMTGYYMELKCPENADKTMQELKDIVMKNLQKDPIFYTKDGQFGVRGLGYTTEAPGLGEPKEAKGKYKSSGYGDLKESIQPMNEEENKLRKVIREMIAEELNTEEFKDVLFKLEQPHLNDKEALGDIQKIYASHSAGLNSISQNLKEGVEKELAEINKEAEHEILSSKLQKINDAIERRQSQLGKLDEDEDMKALTDKKKVKELEKDIKALEKAKAKLEKIINKKGGKAKKAEVLDEIDIEPTEEYLQAKADAEQRYDEGEEIDSIMSNYPNLSDADQERLYQDLEGKMNGMDY